MEKGEERSALDQRIEVAPPDQIKSIESRGVLDLIQPYRKRRVVEKRSWSRTAESIDVGGPESVPDVGCGDEGTAFGVAAPALITDLKEAIPIERTGIHTQCRGRARSTATLVDPL